MSFPSSCRKTIMQVSTVSSTHLSLTVHGPIDEANRASGRAGRGAGGRTVELPGQ